MRISAVEEWAKFLALLWTVVMAAERLANIPQVDISSDGVFKYVLIRVHSTEDGDDSNIEIVRGYAWANYHADIYELVAAELQKGGELDCQCLGGGRINHDSHAKKIHVYGYSVGFGRADHCVATEKLKARYPEYEVTWADEGY